MDFDISEVHPLAVVFGIGGALVGWYMVKVATGTGGFAVGEATVSLNIFWKLLIPIACGGAGFLLTNRMFQE